MDNMIRNAFDSVTMPDDCTRSIETTLTCKNPNRKQAHFPRKLVAAAVCLITASALLCNPRVVQALENTVEKLIEKTEWGENVHYRTVDEKFTVSEIVREDGTRIISGRNNLTTTPGWLVEEDERLYFDANGMRVDVTDRISYETPYTCIYTDSGGFIHYICIGGTYDPDPEKSNVGYGEWIYDPQGNNGEGSWIGGYADNKWDKDTDDDFPWLKKAKAEMGIPFP